MPIKIYYSFIIFKTYLSVLFKCNKKGELMRVTPIESSIKKRENVFFGTHSNHFLFLVGPNLPILGKEISFASKHFLKSNLLMNLGILCPQNPPIHYLNAEKLETFSKGGEARSVEGSRSICGVHCHFPVWISVLFFLDFELHSQYIIFIFIHRENIED